MENKKIEKGTADKYIFYYEKGPMIAICLKCNEFAIFSSTKRLHCPKCGNDGGLLSKFVWDKNSTHPQMGKFQ